MIITKTPLRVSFAGGGTDIEAYYRHSYGSVVSTGINKYVFITINKRFDDTIRVSYSKTEIVSSVEELKHDIVKACLRMTGITRGIEITSISDIPSGTGLGSSSSFTVGLLNALYTYSGEQLSAEELANKACEIEIEVLKHPIGKQDQYAAAYGGINNFSFNADGSVIRNKLILSERDLLMMNRKLMMFYTGIRRSANGILEQQCKDTANKIKTLDYMRDQADVLADILRTKGFNKEFASVLHNGWLKKKSIVQEISNSDIDNIYNKALRAGALGGKLLGAGGGGFILFYCDEDKQQAVRDAIGLRELDFRIARYGSRVVYFA